MMARTGRPHPATEHGVAFRTAKGMCAEVLVRVVRHACAEIAVCVADVQVRRIGNRVGLDVHAL
jgi:hypothetical protein